MRISDWSSDVCSSDLRSMKRLALTIFASALLATGAMAQDEAAADWPEREIKLIVPFPPGNNTANVARIIEIGRASCRERVCQYGQYAVGAGSLKKKQKQRTRKPQTCKSINT